MQELAKELEKLKKVYADTRKTLEEEMLCRIDMENTVQSLREELSFKDQVFQQELQETRTRRQVEISEIGQYCWTKIFLYQESFFKYCSTILLLLVQDLYLSGNIKKFYVSAE